METSGGHYKPLAATWHWGSGKIGSKSKSTLKTCPGLSPGPNTARNQCLDPKKVASNIGYVQLQNIQESVKLFKIKRFLQTEWTLVKVLLADLLLVFRDKRATICHTYSMSIHKIICFKKCLWHVSTNLSLPLSFHCSSKLQATCYSLYHLKYPTLHATIQASTPVHVCAPLFLSGHPSVTNSRFEYTVDGPMWWLTLRRYAPCPWFHHYNSTVTLQKIDVSSTDCWIHSADRCQMWYIFVYHLSLITIPNIMEKAWQNHAIDLVSLEHITLW